MAIEKAGRSGSRNRDEMAPVGLTSAEQNRSARDAGERQPRRREPSAEKDSAEPPAEGTETAEEAEKTEHTKKLNKSNKRKTLRITPDRRTASTGLPEAT